MTENVVPNRFCFFARLQCFNFFHTFPVSVLEKLLEKISFGLVPNDQFIKTRMWKFHLKGLELEILQRN